MRQALEMALEALENASDIMDSCAQKRQDDAITAIKEALAQPEQEPLCTAAMFDDAFLIKSGLSPVTKLYITPPQRTWVGLTDEEISSVAYNTNPLDGIRAFARAIEAKIKEINA